MKIYSFGGKKRITDSFDENPSPLDLGQKFITGTQESAEAQENAGDGEKQIEK